MEVSQQATEQIITILLKYMDKKTALKIARELYSHVNGSKTLIKTFHKIVMTMEEVE